MRRVIAFVVVDSSAPIAGVSIDFRGFIRAKVVMVILSKSVWAPLVSDVEIYIFLWGNLMPVAP